MVRTFAREIKVNPIIKAEAVEAVLRGVLFEFSVASFPRIPNMDLYIESKIETKGFVIDGVMTDIPIKITLAPRPTCCRTDKVGSLKKEYRTPKRTPRPVNETKDPTSSLINNDFLLGVD